MDESNGSENEAKNDRELEKVLRQYDQALQIGHHTDTIIHEVTAIVWGANTLLLGFILEVPCDREGQILVIVAAIVGLFMSVYVPWIHHWTKKSQKVAYGVSRQIETDHSLPYKLHTGIVDVYPKWKPGLMAVWFLTIIFVLAWVGVIWHARACLSVVEANVL